jgi:flagellar biosynthesis anti-sigma factor FlgM
LSDLAQTLQTLASDSPDRQAKIDQIARDYANGSYKVDAQALASKIIDDAVK